MTDSFVVFHTTQVGEEARVLEVTLQCNAALAFLKAQAWAEAAQHAAAALKKEPVRVFCCWADRPRPTPLKRTSIEPTLNPNPPLTITTQANAKALYRRGVARSHLGLLDEAKADLLAAAKAEPNNKDVRRELQVGY